MDIRLVYSTMFYMDDLKLLTLLLALLHTVYMHTDLSFDSLSVPSCHCLYI